eukprot:TRINITY_DN23169_c0_g1_i2.p1 TRINITY_DN23169_c0_g1~~TRINITY_DN23169_c0_g1_i2.p1  ORF type:complete len:419 (+),score=55.04 TRINITY_DN23169_c0_g1_i2:101-1357(+)
MLPVPVGVAPFAEEHISYSTDAFDFHTDIAEFLLGDGAEPLPLERLHELPQWTESSSAKGYNIFNRGNFEEIYHRWVRDFIRPHLGEEYVLFQRRPGLRVQLAGGPGLTPLHIDGDHGHSPWEINVWVPITKSYGSASLWVESAPGKGDFHPLVGEYGSAFRFYGNRCLHFSTDNNEETTRVSFDCRFVRVRDWFKAGVTTAVDLGRGNAQTRNRVYDRWVLFGYYGVMGPNGELTQDEWTEVLSTLTAPADVEAGCPAPPLGISPSWNGYRRERQNGVGRRDRSPSEEHRQKCVEKFGSQKRANKLCPRCGWCRARPSLLKRLVYIDASGSRVPWVAENPDVQSPWGLGCLLCKESKGSSESAYALFSFGDGAPGLPVEALIRHGRHWKTNAMVEGQEELQGREHAAACEAFDVKIP